MAIKLHELIKILKDKNRNSMIEFVIVDTNGNLVCMDLEGKNINMAKVLALFADK